METVTLRRKGKKKTFQMDAAKWDLYKKDYPQFEEVKRIATPPEYTEAQQEQNIRAEIEADKQRMIK